MGGQLEEPGIPALGQAHTESCLPRSLHFEGRASYVTPRRGYMEWAGPRWEPEIGDVHWGSLFHKGVRAAAGAQPSSLSAGQGDKDLCLIDGG